MGAGRQNTKVKRSLQWIWRGTKYAFLTVFTAVVVYALAALILCWWPNKAVPLDCESTAHCYVTTGGVHLDIIIPSQYLPASMQHPQYTDNAIAHYAFGWGERNFFLETPTWADLTFANGAKALLVNSPSIMHVTQYQAAQPGWQRVDLCPEQLTKLLAHIESTFAQSSDGQWLVINADGYTDRDFFFEAKGDYNAINTCNEWVREALRAGGQKTARWAPTTHGVLYHL